MSFSRSDFNSGDDEKIVNRGAVLTHQVLFQQVGDCFACVVIGNGDTIETLGSRRGNHLFGAGNAVTRKKGVGVEIEVERHCAESSFTAGKWKASVSRNGR